MLNDEIINTAIRLTTSNSNLSIRYITELLLKFCDNPEKFGKQTLPQLNKKGKSLEFIPVTNTDLHQVEKELKNYGVDFAVFKHPTDKDLVHLYFKGMDAAQIKNALSTYIGDRLTSKSFEPIKQVIKQANVKAQEHNSNMLKKETTNKLER